MYDIKWIRENPDAFDGGLKRRGLEPQSAKLLALDEKRRAAITKFEQAQARRNAASKEIGEAKKAKDEFRATALMAEVTELKTSLPALDDEQKKLGADLDKELAQIPNAPADDVPVGADAGGNVGRHAVGKKRNYSFKPKQHFELGEALGQMDFELAAKLSGARFVVLQKGLARLERALGQLFLDTHTSEKHGYTEVSPPLLVRDDVMFGTAQLPKFEDDQFFAGSTPDIRQFVFEVLDMLDKTESASRDDILDLEKVALKASRRWLIPTAEVPLTNLVRESIVEEAQLPMRLTACTPCFRAEAGAAGKDTRGMIRQHQFTKVELVSITTPDKSKDEHERMLACAEEVLK
ncbi:MAG TPA: serine--tRNA ligase, partial [Pseudolabrys sp.]|nr:serine--tRNA ligase [Pseudolabrys sp.]